MNKSRLHRLRRWALLSYTITAANGESRSTKISCPAQPDLHDKHTPFIPPSEAKGGSNKRSDAQGGQDADDTSLAQSAGTFGSTRIAIPMFLVFSLICGCAEGPPDHVLPVAEFNTWAVPADGSRIPAPRALYANDVDTVYALDDAGRVLVYSPEGRIQKTWRMPEYENGRPEGVVELLDGRIAVADTHYHRVVFFHDDGSVESMLGEKGTAAGQFVYPVSIAQDPSGFLYVGEYGDRQRIQKFTADGEYVLQFGEHGTQPGQFQRPSGIVWHDGRIYAVDAFNNRIQVFSDDGPFVQILDLSDPAATFEFPYDIRATADGRLFVVENKAARITALRPDGTLLGRFGKPARDDQGFFNPWSLTVLSDGRILVADTGNHRIVELTTK